VGESLFLCGLESYSKHEIDNLRGSKRIVIAHSDGQVRDFVEKSRNREYRGKILLLGKIDSYLAKKIYDKVGINFNGYNLEFRSDEIAHIFKQHGRKETEIPRGQQSISAEDIVNFPSIVSNFDNVLLAADNSLHFIKNINGHTTAVTIYANGNKSLTLKTMYKRKKSEVSGPTSNVINGGKQKSVDGPGLGHNVRDGWTTDPANINKIIDFGEKVNRKEKFSSDK